MSSAPGVSVSHCSQGEDVVKEDRKGGELEVGIYDL